MADHAAHAGGTCRRYDAQDVTDDAQAADAEAPDAEAIERGRKLFAQACTFFFGAQKLDQVPPPGLPEIAFAGRSNVGKSSLVNALTGQKALARVSNTPGRTQQLNFFDLGKRLVLVDMPGYGYARANQDVKQDWQGMMFGYLRGRPSLRRLVLLLDARVDVKAADRQAMELFDKAAVPFQIVLTKADDLKPAPLAAKQVEALALARAHPAGHPRVITTSSLTGLGIPELRAELAALAA
jgi:GTP-binding protein